MTRRRGRRDPLGLPGRLRALALLAAMLPAACGPAAPPAVPGDPGRTPGLPPERALIQLRDVTDEAGIRFTHHNDASARKLLPETMGAGVALFDYDGDGRTDIYLVNGAPLTGDRRSAEPGALYRNLGGLRFADVTQAAGLDQAFYGMGAAVGDVDNDGTLDLFVSGVDGDRLYLNRGGWFEDATRHLGLTDRGFGSSAAFLDYDRDGWLDLFIGRYVTWSASADLPCSPDGVHRTYCTPEIYPGQASRLYQNCGGLGFDDVTERAGLRHPEGKTLGVAVLDFDRDGWPDLALANDTVRNFLYRNQGDGSFREVGITSHMSYSESGATRGGMGIDAADGDGDGLDDIVIGNFSLEMAAYFRGSDGGFFRDDASQVGIGVATLMQLAFGTLFADLDGDGWLDLVFANGHIEPDVASSRPEQSYAQPLQVFHNRGQGHFTPLPAVGALAMPLVGRGLAAGNLDDDGDLDLVVTQNGGPARLLRNDATKRSWVRVRPVGRSSNRTGYGATVVVRAGARTWTRTLRSGSSYLSASEPVVTVGLGDAKRIDALEIVWPSGARQAVEEPAIDRTLVVEERVSDGSLPGN